MAGRAFAFADPRIIELAKTEFIPVVGDDWYQRRRKDDEGDFFRSMAEQGPRKGAGGSTRQGIYTFTADGTLLEFKNAGQDAEATLDQLQRGLKKWKALPAAKRKPGAIAIAEPAKIDPGYTRTLPAGGLVLKVHARILDMKNDAFCRGTCDSTGSMKASRDFLWITAAEAKALAPAKDDVGFLYQLPAGVAQRIARFHLVDNTRGEPNFWTKKDVKELEMTLTVTAKTAEAITLRLDGAAYLTNVKDNRGYEAKLGGTLRFDVKSKAFDRFDLAVVGDHWGDDSVTQNGSRPGKSQFGVAFGLADPKLPSERVSPQAARDWDLYMGKRDE